MSIFDLITKQFIDVIDWTESGDGVLAYRFEMQDREIQNGGQLTVRDSQLALFVNEGKTADLFEPGLYTRAQIEAWRPVANAVHDRDGVIFGQLRHGGRASHVSVDIALDADVLNVNVIDDGIGFYQVATSGPDSPPRGMGLLSMRERVELLGGMFELRSSVGAGTTIRACLPVSLAQAVG